MKFQMGKTPHSTVAALRVTLLAMKIDNNIGSKCKAACGTYLPRNSTF